MSAYAGAGGSEVPLTESQIAAAGDLRYLRQVNAVRTITSADTIVATDIGKTLLFNNASAMTIAITAAATLGNGFWCRFKNIGVGLVTVDPNGSETIDGVATSLVPKGDSGIIVCNGTNFYTMERPTDILVTSGSVSAAANLVLTLPRGLKVVKFKLSNVNPVTNGSALQMEMSTNGGSSYLTLYDRAYGGVDSAGGTAGWAKGNSQATLIITSSMDNGGYNNVIEIDMPYEVASTWTPVKIFAAYKLQSAGWEMRLSAAGAQGGGIITNVRFSMNSGNISTMDYQVIGTRF